MNVVIGFSVQVLDFLDSHLLSVEWHNLTLLFVAQNQIRKNVKLIRVKMGIASLDCLYFLAEETKTRY